MYDENRSAQASWHIRSRGKSSRAATLAQIALVLVVGCADGRVAGPQGEPGTKRQNLEGDFALPGASGAGAGSGSATGDATGTGASSSPTASGTGPSAGRRVVWVKMRERANLDAARGVAGWRNRGQAVRDALTQTATRSQAPVRAFLSSRGATVRPFWITNALRVETDQDTIDELQRRSDVAEVLPDRVYSIPPVERSAQRFGVNATEWGLDSIRVPEAWDTFGLKGEGVVIANIDTGVQFDHPALIAQYRGSLDGGGFNHEYNWFDPSNVCGFPSEVPCDNAGHGTHTMGTMVGDDGDPGDNQIGVAPHAKWIAAKGCEDFSCSLDALLRSAEWILAPTDFNGENARPELRPNIVNNSWGGWGGDPFFQDAVTAWVSVGIFPAFSAGNSGPSCGSVGSPGDYANAYAVGAYDSMGEIAYFSSRGPSFDGVGKPNLAAPGVSVRSSVPGNGYEYYDGTSMASPHLAGTVALMWAAAPALLGDIDATRAVLDETAVDTDDPSCGGTAENNNVWGEGRLDAFAAVDLSPRGPTGTLTGLVTSQETGEALVGASIAIVNSEGRERSSSTGPDGSYSTRLPIGFYNVTVRTFGYLAQTATGVEVSEGVATDRSFALALAPAHAVSGSVVDSNGAPLAGAEVSIVGTPIAPAQTDANGQFVFASVPEGEYAIHVAPSRCYEAQTQDIVVSAALSVDFVLGTRADLYGYSCEPSSFEYVSANTVITDYVDYQMFPVTLPFPFTYYGETYEEASIGSDGYLSFTYSSFYSDGWNTTIPSPWEPNAAIYAQWDDLFAFDGTGSIRTEVLGQEPNRTFVIEWRNVQSWDRYGELLSFEILLHENGAIGLQYGSDATTGLTATIGIEDHAGADGLQYSFNETTVGNGTSILYSLPPSGIVRGVVTDANDGQPVAGAVITAFSGGAQVRTARSNATGQYQLQVPVGDYTISASSSRYENGQVALSIAEDGFYTADFALRSARAAITPPMVQLVTTAGQTRTRTLTLGNEGSVDLVYEISEAGGRRQNTVATRTLARNPNASLNARDTRDFYVQSATPRGWTPDSPGDVLDSFPPAGVSFAWGVGYTGSVWLSDINTRTNTEFGVDGTPTGAVWDAAWGEWPADMAYDGSRNIVCQLAVGGDNGIHCFDPQTGSETESITGSFPWSMISQRGIAYRADDDTFYVAGWNEGVIYHIQGLSHPEPGEVIDQCNPADGNISGLAFNDSMGVLWAATNSETDTIYELNPEDCTVLATIAHPTPMYSGAGLEMDDSGNLWMISQSTNTAYLIESGVPAFSDVPWLSISPTSGTLAPGATQALSVSIDTTGLTPGVYLASIFVRSNSGRQASLRIPVSVMVSAYLQGVEVGGRNYTDTLGDVWSADKAHAVGSWGFMQRGRVVTSNRTIAGATEQSLYRSLRSDPYAYRFDNVPNGIYEIDLRFAELQNITFGRRLYDVIIENTLVLPAHDIAYEVGTFTADDHRFFVEVTDGRMDIRFVSRARSERPIINALRVTHRPDR